MRKGFDEWLDVGQTDNSESELMNGWMDIGQSDQFIKSFHTYQTVLSIHPFIKSL